MTASLAGLAVPPPAPARKEAALRAALAEINAPRPAVIPLNPMGRRHVRAICGYAAVALIGAGIAWLFAPRQVADAPQGPPLAAVPEISPDTFREISELFQGQLNAIIAGPDGFELLLAHGPAPHRADQAVRITLARDANKRTVVTYSGQCVALDFSGVPLSITPLIDADGRVIVVTDDRVYPSPSAPGDGLRISATTIARR